MSDKPPPIARAIKLLEAFHQRGSLATRDVMELFGVDRQVARRDVLALVDAGIPITPVGQGNARRNVLDPAFRRTRFHFTPGDAFALNLARRSMPFLESTLVTEWLDELHAKLGVGRPEQTAKWEAQFQQRLVFLSEPYRSYGEHEAVIDVIIRCLLDDKTAHLDYAGVTRRDKQTVEPLALVVFRRALYLLARRPGTKTLRRFAVERIVSARIGEGFRYPEDFDPRTAFEEPYGISDPQHPISEVRLRFASVTAEYVRARHFHASQRFEDGPDGTVDLVMTTGGRELENLALEYGWTVEVLSPLWLRAKVAEHHRRAAAYYEDEGSKAVVQGEIYWATVRRFPQDDAKPHPHLVIQDDVLNESRLPTVTVVGLTSNPRRANEPGNVLLKEAEGGLEKMSVIVVSQVSTVLKSSLGERIGQLSAERVSQVLDGLRFQHRSFR